MNKLKFYLLIIAVLIGVIARVYGLDIQSLWYDELWTITVISFDFIIALGVLISDVHPPLYYAIMHPWINIFGDSETALRMPSAIAGVLAIGSMYYLGRKVLNKTVAISATIMLALSGSAIYYSQEARMYSFLLLFSVISTLLWLSFINKINKEKLGNTELAVYWIVGLITSYLHYFGTVLIFFQLAYLVFVGIFYKKEVKMIILRGCVIAALFLPWFILNFIFNDKSQNFWMENPDLQFLANLSDFIFTSKIILLILLIPVFINIKGFWRNISERKDILKPDSMIVSLLYLSIVPVLTFMLISCFYTLLSPRYFIIILPAIYLLIPIILSYVPGFNGVKNTGYIFGVVFIGFLMFLYPNYSKLDFKTYYQIPAKQEWREASKYIVENSNDNTIIYTDKDELLYLYYLNRFNKDGKDLKIKRISSAKGLIDINNLADDKNKYMKVFIFNFNEPAQSVKTELENNSISYSKKDFYKMSVYEYIMATQETRSKK
jgi:mannosyltransferase